MTLATRLNISDPVNPELVFLKARAAIGIPAEHPFKIDRVGGAVSIYSKPDGFCSALVVSHNDGALVAQDCAPGVTCDDPCDYHARMPSAFVEIWLDTTYGYRGPNGEICDDVHNEVVASVGAWLMTQGVEWWSHNEYDGSWHHLALPYAAVTS